MKDSLLQHYRYLLFYVCSLLVSFLAKGAGLRPQVKFILDELSEAGNRLPEWKVVHTKREQNCVAHELAQLVERSKHSAVWRF